jgi:hypothetical protein
MQTKSAEIEQNLLSDRPLDKEAIRKGLMETGIPESRIEISQVGCMGYAFDVGPVSLTPVAVVGVKDHADVEIISRSTPEEREAVCPANPSAPGLSWICAPWIRWSFWRIIRMAEKSFLPNPALSVPD